MLNSVSFIVITIAIECYTYLTVHHYRFNLYNFDKRNLQEDYYMSFGEL